MGKYIRIVCARVAADIKQYGMAGVILLCYTVIVNLVFHAFCPLVIVCGLPCPGCGITRAAVCFITGRWRQAWQLNPVIFPIVLTALYFVANRYLLGRSAKGMKWLLAFDAALLLIVYLVRMHLYFPDREPYVYTADNVLAKMFHLYRQLGHR